MKEGDQVIVTETGKYATILRIMDSFYPYPVRVEEEGATRYYKLSELQPYE